MVETKDKIYAFLLIAIRILMFMINTLMVMCQLHSYFVSFVPVINSPIYSLRNLKLNI